MNEGNELSWNSRMHPQQNSTHRMSFEDEQSQSESYESDYQINRNGFMRRKDDRQPHATFTRVRRSDEDSESSLTCSFNDETFSRKSSNESTEMEEDTPIGDSDNLSSSSSKKRYPPPNYARLIAERTKEDLERMKNDPAERIKAGQRAMDTCNFFFKDRIFPLQVEGQIIHSLGKIKCAPKFYSESLLYPVGMSVSRLVYSETQERVVRCTLTIYDSSDFEQLKMLQGFDGSMISDQTEPLFHILVDCQVVDEHLGLSEIARDAIRKAALLNDEDSPETDSDEVPKFPNMDFYGTDLRRVWRDVLVSLGALSRDEADAAETFEQAHLSSRKQLLHSDAAKEPPDEEEEELRRKVGLAIRIRADLRSRHLANTFTLAIARGLPLDKIKHRVRRVLEIRSADINKQLRLIPPGCRENMTSWAEAEISANHVPFFTPILHRLLEGLADVYKCNSYIFIEHRQKGASLLSINMEAAEGCGSGANRMAMEYLEEFWVAQGEAAAKSRRERERSAKKRLGDAERARAKRIKDAEMRTHKQGVEQRRIERVRQRIEQRAIKDHAKEKDRLARNLRRSLESITSRRRVAVKAQLSAFVESEELRSSVTAKTASSLSFCSSNENESSFFSTSDASPFDSLSISKSHTSPLRNIQSYGKRDGDAYADHSRSNDVDSLLEKKIPYFEQIGLDNDLTCSLIQLWDFFHAYQGPLELRHPPTLDELAGALKAAEEVVDNGSADRNSCASRINLLHSLAECLASHLAAPVLSCMGFPMIREPGEDDVLAEPRGIRLSGQLSGRLTWEEVSRLALQAHAHRELGADEREIPQRILFRPPPVPIHFAGASAIPSINAAVNAANSYDRNVLHLIAQRITNRKEKAVHKLKSQLGEFRIQIAAPSQPCIQRCHFLSPLLCLQDSLQCNETFIDIQESINQVLNSIPEEESYHNMRSYLSEALNMSKSEGNIKLATECAIRALDVCPDWPPSPPSPILPSQKNLEIEFLKDIKRSTALSEESGNGYHDVGAEKVDILQLEKRMYILHASKFVAERQATLEGNGLDDYEDDEEDTSSDLGMPSSDSIKGQPVQMKSQQKKGSYSSIDKRTLALFESPQDVPDEIVRCFKILQALIFQNGSDKFLYPKDPAVHTGYYEAVAKPFSFLDVANELRNTENLPTNLAVARFVERIRLVFGNARCHAGGGGGSGGTGGNADLVAAAEAMLVSILADRYGCIFERLLIDWLIDPNAPEVVQLDDTLCQKCKVFSVCGDESQINTTSGNDFLICDRCCAKFHLRCIEVEHCPENGWFCEKCVKSWGLNDIDPIVGSWLPTKLGTETLNTQPSLTFYVKSVRWCHRSGSRFPGEFLYQLAPGSVPSDPPVAEVTWEQLNEFFKVPENIFRPYQLLADIPGYSLHYAAPPSISSGISGVAAGLDPTLSSRAAILDSISTEYRALGQAVAAMGEESEFGRCHGIVGARRWLRLLSAMMQAIPLVSASIQRAMADTDTVAVDEAKISQQADINSFSIFNLPKNLLPTEHAESSSVSASDDEDIGSSSETRYNSRSNMDIDPSSQVESSDDGTVSEENPFGTISMSKIDRPASTSSTSHSVKVQSLMLSPPEAKFKFPVSTAPKSRISTSSPVPSISNSKKNNQGRTRSSYQNFSQETIIQDDEIIDRDAINQSVSTVWRTERQERRWTREEKMHLIKLKQELEAGLGFDTAKEMIGILGGKENDSSDTESECEKKSLEIEKDPLLCAFCDGDELSLCSTMVQAQNWEEASALYLGYPPNLGDTLEESVLREYQYEFFKQQQSLRRFRVQLHKLGLVGPCDVPLATRNDFNRFIWLPINEVQRSIEFESLVAALKAEKEDCVVDDSIMVKDTIAVAGSLIAHECCAEAVAALRAPKLALLASRVRKEIFEEAALNNIGGRTQPLGSDTLGRLYWQFPHHPSALFVQPAPNGGWIEGGCEALPSSRNIVPWERCESKMESVTCSGADQTSSKWLCFSGLKEVALQLFRLNTDDSYDRELQRAIIRRYPKLREALFDPAFVFSLINDPLQSVAATSLPVTNILYPSDYQTEKNKILEFSTFSVGQLVVISSSYTLQQTKGSTKYLATVTNAAKFSEKSRQWLVRIAPLGWPSSFSCWVPISQLHLASDVLRQSAAQDFEKMCLNISRRFIQSAPVYLSGLLAVEAFNLPQRERSSNTPPPCFDKNELVISSLARAKAALLTIEAALPSGAWEGIENLSILEWRDYVKNADSSRDLMEACLLLEASISKVWVRGGGINDVLLPTVTASLRAATPGAVCFRAWVLDRSLVYDRANIPIESERRTNRKSSLGVSRVASTEAEYIMGVGVKRPTWAKRSHVKKKIGAGRFT